MAGCVGLDNPGGASKPSSNGAIACRRRIRCKEESKRAYLAIRTVEREPVNARRNIPLAAAIPNAAASQTEEAVVRPRD